MMPWPGRAVGYPAEVPSDIVGGEYRILERIGAGGMGTVHVAEQLSTGKRRALKVMHPSMVLDAKLRERFEQEARVGSMARSRHIVEVIDAGVDEATGSPWIAMELLEGRDLGAYRAAHERFDAAAVGEILRQLCHALGAAHRVGVVHRDIRPENVFVARDDDADAPHPRPTCGPWACWRSGSSPVSSSGSRRKTPRCRCTR